MKGSTGRASSADKVFSCNQARASCGQRRGLFVFPACHRNIVATQSSTTVHIPTAVHEFHANLGSRAVRCSRFSSWACCCTQRSGIDGPEPGRREYRFQHSRVPVARSNAGMKPQQDCSRRRGRRSPRSDGSMSWAGLFGLGLKGFGDFDAAGPFLAIGPGGTRHE